MSRLFRFFGLPSWVVFGLSLCLSFGFGFALIVGLFHYASARPLLVVQPLPVVPERRPMAPIAIPPLWTTGEVIVTREQPHWVF